MWGTGAGKHQVSRVSRMRGGNAEGGAAGRMWGLREV